MAYGKKGTSKYEKLCPHLFTQRMVLPETLTWWQTAVGLGLWFYNLFQAIYILNPLNLYNNPKKLVPFHLPFTDKETEAEKLV